MKAFKIILTIIVLSIISFFIWRSCIRIDDPPEIRPPLNQYAERIEQDIDSLKRMPKRVFSNEYYKEIQYRITEYHKEHLFSKTENDNNQWQEILSKDLYSTYAQKFIEQAFYVFKGQEWNINKLSLIRSEVKSLQNSTYLENESEVDKKFNEIRSILSKYDEISNFISSCNSLSFPNYAINAYFPIDDVKEKIDKSKATLQNNLGNSYVNNCIRLKDGLKGIPLVLFLKHADYLNEKINQYTDSFSSYNYQADYSSTIYSPLLRQIYILDNDIYGINDDTFNTHYNNLETKLNRDNRNATDYFRSQKRN